MEFDSVADRTVMKLVSEQLRIDCSIFTTIRLFDRLCNSGRVVRLVVRLVRLALRLTVRLADGQNSLK